MGGVFLGLPLPVMVAFIVLLLGLALLARQLHHLYKPAVVRRGPGDAGRAYQARRD
ncbi:hypothetical protein [Massilia niabensis]|uniref:Uncharacterized protein n=1 Tax=Massilia niabensis TaxID=544910 RepID=A0ABW0L027_9BURK